MASSESMVSRRPLSTSKQFVFVVIILAVVGLVSLTGLELVLRAIGLKVPKIPI